MRSGRRKAQTLEVVDFEGTSALLELEEAGKLEIVEAVELEKVRELEDRSNGRRGFDATPHYTSENRGQTVD